jgi:hypothetical protein
VKRLVLAAGLLAAGAGLTACGSSGSAGTVPTAKTPKHDMSAMQKQMASTGLKSPGAAVALLTPHTHESERSTVSVRVRLKHFTLDPAAVGMSPRPNHGHLHFELDGGRFDTTRYSGPNGALAAKLGVSGMYSPSVTPTITYRHLPAGRHKLDVYLANNNHTRTGVEAETTFVVR